MSYTRRPRGFLAVINIRDLPPSLLHLSSSRMPATRLCPVIELTPLPPAVRALYAPPPAQSKHRTVSNAATCPTHRSPRVSSVKNAAARPHPASSHPSAPVPRNAKGRPQKTTTTICGVTASSSISCRAGSPCVYSTTPEAQMLSTMSIVQTVCRRLPLWLSVVQSEKDGSRVTPRARPGRTWKH